MSERSSTRVTAVVCLYALLAGCMVGPNFHSPKSPHVTSYTEVPLPKKTSGAAYKGSAGKAQEYVTGLDIPADWWYLFHSPQINQLVVAGLANSPTLPAAKAALVEAQETLKAQIGNSLYPAFDAALTGQRQKFAGASFGGGVASSLFNLYNANVSVAYTLDVFGGARRQIESLLAQVDYQRYQLIAAYLTLTSNIVTTAVTVASYEAQIKATQELIRAEEGQLTILRQQFQLGGVALSNVLTQQTLVEQTRATLPPLQKSLSQSLHSLSVLVGEFPDQRLPVINLDALVLPRELPVSLPSDFVCQRPDVQSSSALLHAASAQIGVATANLFPQFTITGTYGWSGSVPSTLFRSSNIAWNYGSQIAQPIFHGGALQAQRRAAIAAYNQVAAQYHQTLLQAFQNVADSLRALETDARTFRDQRAAELSARQNWIITKQQYALGGVSYLNLLTAQQQYQQAVISRVQAQAARYADTAALFQSLGGGWWNKKG